VSQETIPTDRTTVRVQRCERSATGMTLGLMIDT
jgi:hypothetical protein